MSSTKNVLVVGDVLHCPHCAKALEASVEDYSIPGRIGPASRTVTECEWCDGKFSVEEISSGNFVVEKK
jgi:C4-type Zn-finger protein